MRCAVGVVLLVACSAPSPAPAPPVIEPVEAPRRFGELMAEVGQRFERIGEAGAASQWELAAYDLTELDEIFEGDVPTSRVPEDVPADVHALAASFADTALPPLEQAVASRDAAAFTRAFASTGEACNACHASSDHAFIRIPTVPGMPVPIIGPSPVEGPAEGTAEGTVEPTAPPE